MLVLKEVIHRYQGGELQIDRLHIKAGERVIILGPSGAGKSTLLQLLAGFRPINSGYIRLNAQDHSNTPPNKRPVSILFQENNLFPHLTVAQNIALGMQTNLKLSHSQQEKLAEIAGQMQLQEKLSALPAQLSGGQRQRVALARCLVRQKPILLLDEPFSALDPVLRHEMRQLLLTICASKKLTLLMVSHDLCDLQEIAQRAILIVEGKILYDGETRPLLTGEAKEAMWFGIKKHVR